MIYIRSYKIILMKYLLFNLFVILLSFHTLKAQTFLTTDFHNDDTLRKSKSPYVISKDLVVFQNVTLHIEPGTTILFNNNTLTIRGNLIADGSANDSIRFASQDNTKCKGLIIQKNDKIFPYQLYLKNCVAENFDHFITVDRNNYWMRGKFFLKHCSFRYNKYVFQNRPPFLDDISVDSCMFYNNYFCLKGNHDDDYDYYTVTNSKFIDNNIGVEGCHIDNCFFTGHTIYAVRYFFISNSILYNNSIGLDGVANKHSLAENNEIVYNDVGLNIHWTDNLPTGNTFFKNNKVCHNRVWNMKNVAVNDGSVFNTCWCSSDSVAIRKTISDGYTDNRYGRLFFTYTDTCTPSLQAPHPPTSVREEIVRSNVKLFPNPVTNKATLLFEYSDSYNYTVVLTDVTGKIINTLQDISSGMVIIDRENIQPGIYIVILRTEQSIISVQKMVVQ